jgi:hypothetical protein
MEGRQRIRRHFCEGKVLCVGPPSHSARIGSAGLRVGCYHGTAGRQSATDELPVSADRLNRGQQVDSGASFHHIAYRPKAKSFFHDFGRGFLAYKNYLGFGGDLADSPSGFDSVQAWKSDVEHNQLRLQFFGFLYCFESICGLADDLQSRLLS